MHFLFHVSLCLIIVRVTYSRLQIRAEMVRRETRIRELEDAKFRILKAGVQSVSVSAGGGSKQVSYKSVAELDAAIAAEKTEWRKWRALLSNSGPIRTVAVIRR